MKSSKMTSTKRFCVWLGIPTILACALMFYIKDIPLPSLWIDKGPPPTDDLPIMYEPTPPSTLDFDSIIKTDPGDKPGTILATIRINANHHWGPSDRVVELFLRKYNQEQPPERTSISTHRLTKDTLQVPLVLYENITYELTAVLRSWNDTGILFQGSTYIVINNSEPKLISPSILKQEENDARRYHSQSHVLPSLNDHSQAVLSPDETVNLYLNILVEYQSTPSTTTQLPWASYEVYYFSGSQWLPGPSGSLDINGAAYPQAFPFSVKPDSTFPIRVDIYLRWNNGSSFQISSRPSTPSVMPYAWSVSQTITATSTKPIPVRSIIGQDISDEINTWNTVLTMVLSIQTIMKITLSAFHVWYPAPVGIMQFDPNPVPPEILIPTGRERSYMSVAHEIGHRAWLQLAGGFPPGVGGSHSFCDDVVHHPGLALTEGYAAAFALAAYNDMTPGGLGNYWWYETAIYRRVEWYTCSKWMNATTDEGRAAALLWGMSSLDTGGDLVEE